MPRFATRCSGRVVTVLMMERSPFDWLSLALRWCTTLLTDFRSEFRPIDSMQPTFLTCLTSVQRKHCLDDGESASGLLVLFGWGCLVCLVCLPFGVCLCSFPHHHVVFPFLSMMTWALRPHGVRTRGKNITHTMTKLHTGRGHFALGPQQRE